MSGALDASDASERRSIAGRAGTVATGTLASRLAGAARDAVIAATFPLAATDAFWMAFTIPNALRVLLGEGAVSAAFVPVFTRVQAQEGDDAARRFHAGLRGAMGVVLFAIAALGAIAAPFVVSLYALGYRDDPMLFDTTVLLTRIVFPYIFLMGIAALATGGLHARRRFLAPAFAPVMLNVALIAAPFVFVPVATSLGWPPVAALGIGALVGGVLHVLFQWPALAREGLLARPRLGFADPNVRAAFRLLVPLLAGLGVYQLNIVLARQFTSFLPEGALSYLYYGQRLVEIPQGMFALAIATASLPSLAEHVAKGATEEAKRLFRYALRLNLFVAIPASVALAVLAEPTVAVLFGRGAFDATDVAETARSLLWQAIGIWAVASVRTVVPMFHAYNDTRTPVIAAAINLLVFVGVASASVGVMAHSGVALATSLAAAAQLGALLLLLDRRAGGLQLGEVARSAARSLGASVPMALAAFAVLRVGAFASDGPELRRIVVFVAATAAGALAYVAGARALRAPELDDVLSTLRRKLDR